MRQLSNDCRRMSRKVARPDLLFRTEVVMDLQLKLFRLHTAGTYFFMIAQGIMDVAGIKALFHEIAKGTQSLLYCKVLVDLVDATMRLDVAAVSRFSRKPRAQSLAIRQYGCLDRFTAFAGTADARPTESSFCPPRLKSCGLSPPQKRDRLAGLPKLMFLAVPCPPFYLG